MVLQQSIAQLGKVVLGKEPQIKLAMACLLAKGHLLIEDLPGMGKTTLAHALAAVLGLQYQRVQFTSDMLPADLLGISVFDAQNSKFDFHPGPIFTQLMLADEINRSTPKTQSALLEAMEEGQVSIEGETRPLPQPFFVLATQNPVHQSGTFPLPESQLDRFLMRISLGYPSAAAERMLLKGINPRSLLKNLQSTMSLQQLADLQDQAQAIHASDHVLDYVQRLIQFSREYEGFSYGISPRGALALISAAKAWALIEGREHLIPEDVQAVMPAVMEHRLRASSHGAAAEALVDIVLNAVDVIQG
ncbi:AAA family ATPase [uncultured Pseudoteredinibacter sp.]|uniref:AAA family ATPase n=1 Tax=uncultured Pseudoteredinibacter sp. TaxID=1641701 RepID=UPI00260B9CCF|nr:AAA family ATPase [uncultured Pseudoteredinibacter sp.]